MNITIIGSGRMAKAIGLRLLTGGHSIDLHVRDVAKTQSMVEELNKTATATARATVLEMGSRLQEVVILAIPYSEISAVITHYDLSGKIVVDISNPIDFSTLQLITEPGTSGAEEIAALVPAAKVVKAFNTLFDSVLLAGSVDGKSLDVFVASDDQEVRKVVSELIDSSGMRAIDAGLLANARHLEGIELLHITAQKQLKTNRMSALQVVS